MQLATHKFFRLATNSAERRADKAQIYNDCNGRHDSKVGNIEREILLHKQRDIDAGQRNNE